MGKQTKPISTSDIMLINVAKDAGNIGRNYFAAFDGIGDYVTVKFNNGQLIDHKHSFDEKKLKKMGFKIKRNEVVPYLEDKGYKIEQKCNCLVKIDDEMSEKESCKPKDCATAMKSVYIPKEY